MARTKEVAFNALLAEELIARHPRWDQSLVTAEATDVLMGTPAKSPDIVVGYPGESSVIVETEFEPAHTVEIDARSRLGVTVKSTGDMVEQVVAVRIPAGLRNHPSGKGIAEEQFSYCSFTQLPRSNIEDASQVERFPRQGWIRGGIDDLTGFIERAALSESRITQGAQVLEFGVEAAAGLLHRDLDAEHSQVLGKVAAELHQEPGIQTTRMAMAVVTNALIFHTAIAGTHQIDTLDQIRSRSGTLTKVEVLVVWREILAINYWPIFDIAVQVMAPVPDAVANKVLQRLSTVAGQLAGLGVTTTGDMAGQMFGQLISDRKFLATFYTLPSSAALLAELAVQRLAIDYRKPDQVTGLKVADLACGTGALLSAAYSRITARVRRAGLDDQTLHPQMIEQALVGADIMPAATHLTAAILSSAHPTVTFGRTNIYTMPYGTQPEGRAVAIGSLDLIEDKNALTLFGTGRRVATGIGEEDAEENMNLFVMDHGSAHVVIMNPPFTRPTNHETASAAQVPVPSFAGFNTEKDEQRAMAAALRSIHNRNKRLVGHGNAGLASNFLDVAHAKVKPGGVLALVLPVVAISGGSWAKARQLLDAEYTDITVITLATTGSTSRAFSADTGMAELLLIATRRGPGQSSCSDALWVNLTSRPSSAAEAVEIARGINDASSAALGWLQVGRDRVGNFLRAPLRESGCAQLAGPDVARTALALSTNKLWLSRIGSLTLPTTQFAELGSPGSYHLDIRGWNVDGTPRGPFDIHPLPTGQTASYPVLWSHDHRRETRLIVEPDSQGRVRDGCDEKARKVWKTATQLHFNLDFQINSQPLAACLTPHPTIGGRAWPNWRLRDPAWEKLIALWANTTLGLISFWWKGTRQHQGRAVLTITRLGDLPVLDSRQLTQDQIAQAQAIFDEFATRDLRPANEAYQDHHRITLDQAVLIDLLKLPEDILEPLGVLRRQWCAEPTVHGGKPTRPQ